MGPIVTLNVGQSPELHALLTQLPEDLPRDPADQEEGPQAAYLARIASHIRRTLRATREPHAGLHRAERRRSLQSLPAGQKASDTRPCLHQPPPAGPARRTVAKGGGISA